MKVHQWRIKRKYYDLLLAGAKRYEVRVRYGSLRKVAVGDQVVFSDYSDRKFTIKSIKSYDKFADIKEAAGDIIPGANREEMLNTLYSIYPADKEALGVYVFELEPPHGLLYLSKLVGKPSFKKVADELYALTDWICEDYPQHKEHYYGKYLNGLSVGAREVIGYYIGTKPVGIAILKKDIWEKKISTLFVDPAYRGKGIASRLVSASIHFLGNSFPVITIADYKVPQFEGLIKKFGWTHTETLPKEYYNGKHEEWVYNS